MKKYYIPLLIILGLQKAGAQTVTSPYSILGIGDLETKSFSRYFITGNTTTARRDEAAYNPGNPAALTALPFKTMHFDLSLRGRSSVFTMPSTGDRTDISKDFTFKRGTLAFKVNQQTGIAMGIQPYSTANYLYAENASISDGSDAYTKITEGSGGINQFFFSAGRSVGKHVSAGISASWLFGALQRNTTYYSEELSMNIVKEDRDFYTGGQLKGGLQYYTAANTSRKWKHNLGITGTLNTGLKGQLTSTYLENSVALVKEVTDDRQFALPVQATIGYAATYKDKLTLTADAGYAHWKYQALNFKNSYTAPAVRISAGMEYASKIKTMNGLVEKVFVGCGVHAEESYMRVNGQKIRDVSVSFGAGFSPARTLSLYGGVELGKKGETRLGLIKESYTQFIFGITVKDIWIGTKKFGRYY